MLYCTAKRLHIQKHYPFAQSTQSLHAVADVIVNLQADMLVAEIGGRAFISLIIFAWGILMDENVLHAGSTKIALSAGPLSIGPFMGSLEGQLLARGVAATFHASVNISLHVDDSTKVGSLSSPHNRFSIHEFCMRNAFCRWASKQLLFRSSPWPLNMQTPRSLREAH